ncbi:MAG: DUF3237 domain-containing protein [Blastocatellia bacterium]|nr:DUF3237 domain-containing protein [Blastocatellia bacterium]
MELKPPTPRLELLCHLAVKIAAPQMLGPVLTGERRIIPITGGRFEGQRLRGDILPGGADWQIVTADGTAMLEARYTLRTDDGALIYVRNVGFRHGPPEVLAAIARGEQVDPAKYYFRATPTLETGDKKYAWLNRIIAVCSAVRLKEEVLLDFYEIK